MRSKREHGVITILVAFLLAGILSVGTLSLEAGRYQAAKTQLGEANVSAGSSMIAAYNSALFDRFGLLAIDSTVSNVGRYEEYLRFNSDLSAGYKGNNLATFYSLNTVEMECMYNLTYPSVLKRQILSRAKYNVVPQDYSLNYYNLTYFLSDFQSKASFVSDSLAPVATGRGTNGSANDIPAEMQGALVSLYSYFQTVSKSEKSYDAVLDSGAKALLPSVTGTVESPVFSEDSEAIRSALTDAQTILGSEGVSLATGTLGGYREVDVSVNVSFISNLLPRISSMGTLQNNARSIVVDCRAMVQAILAAMNTLSGDKEGNLLLNSYIAGSFPYRNGMVDSYYGPQKNDSASGEVAPNFIGACVEYVAGGSGTETDNQQIAYDYVMAVRLIGNLYAAISNSTSFNANNACSVAAHVAWAYYETFADCELMARYGATVPMTKYEPILPIRQPATVQAAFQGKNFVKAMQNLGVAESKTKTVDGKEVTVIEYTVEGTDASNYRDGLALALWLVPNSKKLLRVADLVQLEMRYREQLVEKRTPSFLMSEQNTFCRTKCVATLNPILPVISPGISSGMDGIEFQSVNYVGY